MLHIVDSTTSEQGTPGFNGSPQTGDLPRHRQLQLETATHAAEDAETTGQHNLAYYFRTIAGGLTLGNTHLSHHDQMIARQVAGDADLDAAISRAFRTAKNAPLSLHPNLASS